MLRNSLPKLIVNGAQVGVKSLGTGSQNSTYTFTSSGGILNGKRGDSFLEYLMSYYRKKEIPRWRTLPPKFTWEIRDS